MRKSRVSVKFLPNHKICCNCPLRTEWSENNLFCSAERVGISNKIMPILSRLFPSSLESIRDVLLLFQEGFIEYEDVVPYINRMYKIDID